jgi:phospholipid transport system substrate-binding protein
MLETSKVSRGGPARDDPAELRSAAVVGVGTGNMKRWMAPRFAAALLLLAIVHGARPVFAGAATDAVEAEQTSLFGLLAWQTPESEQKIAALFDRVLDDPAMAEASLGTEWAARTDAEKARFSDLLKRLVRRYRAVHLKAILGYDLEYLGEKTASGHVLVTVLARSKTNARDEPVEISFAMALKGATWKVQDIVTEGVSLVTSYRSQFTKIIRRDGFPALIARMEAKLARLARESAPPAPPVPAEPAEAPPLEEGLPPDPEPVRQDVKESEGPGRLLAFGGTVFVLALAFACALLRRFLSRG